MTTFIVVYHTGVVITNEIGSDEFGGMKETFLLNEFLTVENVVLLESRGRRPLDPEHGEKCEGGDAHASER
jgi:hypothetical protein